MKALKRLIKGLIILVIVVVVSVIAAVVVVVNMDPNEYKEWITNKVKEDTGRTLTFDGDLKVTFYPWLGLETQGITLGNAAGFGKAPFFHTDYVKLRIKLLPILKGQYEVDTVSVHGAVINLAKNKKGVTNWDDLAGVEAAEAGTEEKQEKQEKKKSQGLPLAGLLLGGVDIKNASFSWDDKTTNSRYRVRKLNFSTDKLVYGEPIKLLLTLNASSNKPAVKGNAKLTGTITYDLGNERYSIKPLQLDATIHSKNVKGGKADIAFSTAIDVNLDEGTALISPLSLDALGTSISGKISAYRIESAEPSIKAEITVKGADLAQLFQAAEIEPLATQIGKLKNRKFELMTVVAADMKRGDVNVSKMTAQLLGATINADVKATDIQSEAPAFKGSIDASGPDLPTLIQVAGQFSGGDDTALAQYGKQLAAVPNKQKAFKANAKFDADMEDGDIDVPALSFNALGINISGKLTAKDMQGDSGKVDGNITLQGRNIKGLLVALDQKPLSQVLQSVDLNVGIKGGKDKLDLKPVALKLTVAGKDIPKSPADINLNAETRINLTEETLVLKEFSIAGLGLNIRGKVEADHILKAPAFAGEIKVKPLNLRKLMRQFKQKPPDTADRKVLLRVALDTKFDGTANSIGLKEMALVLDDTNIKGDLSVTDFKTAATRFKIDIDNFNADRYLPPEEEGSKKKPVTPETAAGAATKLPVETLRALDIKGDVTIGKLVFSGAKMENIKLSLNAKGGNIALDPATADLYKGKYSGKINLDATGKLPKLSVNTSLKGVEAEPLLKDVTGEKAQLHGTGNFSAALTSIGSDTDSLTKNLSGKAELDVKNGVLFGIDVHHVLEEVEIIIESKKYKKVEAGEKTEFEKLSATLDINKGVVTNNDLIMLSPGIKVTGEGMLADLNRETIKYKLVLAVDKTSAERDEERYNIGNYSVPVKCTGNLYDPTCLPDLSKIAKSLAAAPVKKEIKKIEKKITKKLEETVGDEVKDKLKGLFKKF